MTGQRVSQILWVGEHPDAVSLPYLAVAKLAIIALDQLDAALTYLSAGHRVDGILLDLMVSATEGLNSLQALLGHAPDVPIIVLVSPSQTYLGLEAVRVGVQDYLIKGQTPFAEICRAVGCAIERHRWQRAIARCPFSECDLDTAPRQDQRYQNIFQGVRDYVMVMVSDTGVGMTADLLSRAFEPFFTTKDKDKGTGLGLSMVHSFVCQSNGHVTIDSEPGVGTTVRLNIPRCGDRQSSVLEDDQLPEAISYRDESALILLVEDNALVQDYARQQLESLGYRVLVADNGPTALEMLRQQPEIDLLFTDVLMPGGLNGRELAAAACRLRPQLRVLYTSGYTKNVLNHQDGIEAEIPLLPKPYQRAELARKIRQALTGG